jgi:SAM-dependent methyltransferase
MLEIARRVVLGKESIPLPQLGQGTGFGPIKVRGRGCTNVLLMQADAQRLPIRTACADALLSTFMIDRLTSPTRHLRECCRVLRSGGRLILTDPLNWQHPAGWKRYRDTESVLQLVRRAGFAVDVWFDKLPFLEIKDARGSFDSFQTLVAVGTKHA